MSSDSGSKGALALQTAVAMVLALVVYVIASILTSTAMFFFERLMSDIRPEIIAFSTVITGSVIGVYAARSACDMTLRSYSARAVAIWFEGLAVAALVFEFAFVPLAWTQINSFAQIAAVAVSAIVMFWNHGTNIESVARTRHRQERR